MRRPVLIVAMATLSALAAAQGVTYFQTARANAEPVVEEAPQLRRAAVVSDVAEPGANASVRKAKDGHFWAEAQVQGRHVRFLVDTGASTVALTPADARRLGLDVAALSFDRPVSTAAGQTMAAGVTLDYVSVSGARVNDVEAVVLKDGLDVSLLGMTYLGRLSRFEASRDALILRR